MKKITWIILSTGIALCLVALFFLRPYLQRPAPEKLGLGLPMTTKSLLSSIWPQQAYEVRMDQHLLRLMEDETKWLLQLKGERRDIPNYLEVSRLAAPGKD